MSSRIIDRFMPTFDVRTVHSIRIRQAPARVLEVAESFDLESLPLVRGLFRIRGWLLRASPLPARDPRPLLEQMSAMGWGTLAVEPGHARVLGAVTRPWEANVRFTPVEPERFASFADPGLVKIAWTLEADPDPAHPGATLFRTETRAAGTDDDARRRFRRYWRIFSPGILLIRLALLPALRRASERPGSR